MFALLDTSASCAAFCSALQSAVGPTWSEILLIGGALGLGWWRTRKAMKVASAAVDRAHVAEQKAADARTEVRVLKSSLPYSSIPPIAAPPSSQIVITTTPARGVPPNDPMEPSSPPSSAIDDPPDR